MTARKVLTEDNKHVTINLMEGNNQTQNIQQPAQTTQNPTKHTHWLLLLIIILLVAFIASIGTYYYLSQQKGTIVTPPPQAQIKPTAIPTIDPTANWKTYINSKYQFSFKYPENLNINTNDSGADFSNKNIQCQRECPIVFNVNVNNQGPDFNNIYSISNNAPINNYQGGPGEKAIKVANINLDGQEATQYLTYTSNNYTLQTLLKKDNFYILFQTHGLNNFTKEDLDNFRPTFDQILSTFKFTQ